MTQKPKHTVPNGYCYRGDPSKEKCVGKECNSTFIGKKQIVLFAKNTKSGVIWLCNQCARKQNII